MRIFTTASILLLVFWALSCSDTNNNGYTPSWTVNPNGDSELALLMRDMFDDGMRMKMQIEKGEKPKLLEKFEAIHTAQATEPEKAASPEFKAFADSYLSILKSFENANPGNAGTLYNGLVESCMNCHKAMCPGPVVKIKQLYLDET